MKVFEEEKKPSCYDISSLDEMASLTGLTDERLNKPSEDYHENVACAWFSFRSVGFYEAHRRAISCVSRFKLAGF